MNAGLRRNSKYICCFFHAFLYWAVPAWPDVREYYITSFVKLLGFQASLGTQLTTLITHDDARITIPEMHHVKPIIFLKQSTNYSQEIDCSLANFKFAFCNWNSRNSIIIKKNTKQKANFDFVRVLRALLCTLWVILIRWTLFLRSSFYNISNLRHRET